MILAYIAVALAFVAGTTAGAAEEDARFVLVAPMYGCPVRLPTHESASAYCRSLDKGQCGKDSICHWRPPFESGGADTGNCEPRRGTYVAMPSANPNSPFPGARRMMPSPKNEPVPNPFKEAQALVAKGEYDLAISEYTRQLRGAAPIARAQSEIRVLRGRAYEGKGDVQNALRDYCMSVAYATHWQSEAFARQRIVALVRGDAPGKGIAAPGETQTLRPVPVTSGVIRRRRTGPAPFKVTAPPGSDYVLKLVNERDNQEEMLIYVKGGSTVDTTVPLGRYRIRGASGKVWYGPDHYFGDGTQYFEFQASGSAVDEVFLFYRSDNTYHGTHITLQAVVGGNLNSKPIDKADFDR